MNRLWEGDKIAITGTNLSGLLRLLDEPDEQRADPLIEHIAEMPIEDRDALLDQATGLARSNVKRAVVRARYLALESQWEALRKRFDLEQALTLISTTGDSSAALPVRATLDKYAEEVGERLSGDRAFDDGLGAIATVLAQKHNLRGNVGDYYSPDNSYLGSVLATGLGIPISLCCVAILIGRRLELPISGIGTPGHFLGFYGDVDLKIGRFFDPFGGFTALTMGKLQNILSQHVTSTEPGMLTPVTDREIVQRSIRNIAFCYAKLNQPEHIRNLDRWNMLLTA
ncbi:MAG: transglutaminase-like domain-containing protein [Planctomycetota bacterium]